MHTACVCVCVCVWEKCVACEACFAKLDDVKVRIKSLIALMFFQSMYTFMMFVCTHSEMLARACVRLHVRVFVCESTNSKIINSLFWLLVLYSWMHPKAKQVLFSCASGERFCSTFPLPVKKRCFSGSFELKIVIFFPGVLRTLSFLPAEQWQQWSTPPVPHSWGSPGLLWTSLDFINQNDCSFP